MKTLIRGGRVIDPANHVDAVLNILTEGKKIIWAGTGEPEADRIIDASGKIVCPGFIDIHMHEDPLDAEGGIAFCIFDTMLRMGVTTAVGGNCGDNLADPLIYLDIADRGAPVNIALLAGQRWFRHQAGALDRYQGMNETQKQQMEREITRALSGGCVGLSFGLRYDPGTDHDELYRAAACCVPSGKMIAAHVRDDADAVFGAIDEFVGAGEAYGLPVQISHIGSMGGFGQMEEVLRQIDGYKLRGLDISADCYPYEAYSTSIGATTYDEGWTGRYRCGYDVLEFCEGKYKGQRATPETFAEVRAAFPACLTVCHVMKGSDIDLAYTHPNVMVGSDGLLSGGQGHPRAAGTFARVFAKYVKTGKLRLYDAVAKMTAMPAAKLRLTHKGRLNAGADADITILDPRTIQDHATFAAPLLPPTGVEWVMIAGEIALEHGEIRNDRLGQSVRT